MELYGILFLGYNIIHNITSLLLNNKFQVATVGAGAKMADVDAKTVCHSLVTPLGSYSELGVAGFTLLGGTGFLSRSYGCTADNALEFGKPLLGFL